MADKKYKLTYFNARGQAETIRMLFALGGLEYEDIRLEHEEWNELKKSEKCKAPQKQLPILEVDDKVLPQSRAISRYLAREIGLYGSNSWDAAQIDVVTETFADAWVPLATYFYEKDEERKKELKKKFEEETLPKVHGQAEQLLINNQGGDGFFVGDKVSFADVAFLGHAEGMESVMIPNSLDRFPKLKALVDRVKAVPEIKKWMEVRPKTAM